MSDIIEKLGIPTGWKVYDDGEHEITSVVDKDCFTVIESSYIQTKEDRPADKHWAEDGYYREVPNKTVESILSLSAAAPKMLEALIDLGLDGIFNTIGEHDTVIKTVESATGKSWEEIKELIDE